ncbi:MAG: Uncharacterised protein [Marine Group II euryarchaeote MED-G33]|nr:MAG: Uncharacterised protein [Marine Group II euryarchaeote MED-G33]
MGCVDRIMTKVFGGFCGSIGSVGSLTFGVESREKFLMPRINESRFGIWPGSSGCEALPNTWKQRSISVGDMVPEGIPRSHASVSVTFPYGSEALSL